MSRQHHIIALCLRVEQQIWNLRKAYWRSAGLEPSDPFLQVEVKNACENLRSALDYIAADIRDTCCVRLKKSKRFYFPILPNRAHFSRKVERWFPGLESRAPDLWEFLESIQPYQPGHSWLRDLNQVTVSHRHRGLTELLLPEPVSENLEGCLDGRPPARLLDFQLKGTEWFVIGSLTSALQGVRAIDGTIREMLAVWTPPVPAPQHDEPLVVVTA